MWLLTEEEGEETNTWLSYCQQCRAHGKEKKWNLNLGKGADFQLIET